jgi:hypothetical protein
MVTKNPSDRQRIIKAFKLLSDIDNQHRHWTTPNLLRRLLNFFLMHFPLFTSVPNGDLADSLLENRYWHSLSVFVLDIIIGEFHLHTDSLKQVGSIFYNENEGEEIQTYCQYLNKLILEIGDEKSDSTYLNHREWPKVINGAKEIYNLLNHKTFN